MKTSANLSQTCGHANHSRMHRKLHTFAAYAMIGLLLATQSLWARGKKGPSVEPDYTAGEKPARTDIPWNLGPTGASGDIWGRGGDDSTRDTRMIHINSVAKGSPADGVLQPGDVIVGIISPHADGKPQANARFTSDVRFALAKAITLAEENEQEGQLVLNIWREGKTMPASLKLAVKGSFSKTAPYACEKTNRIIQEAAQSILRRGFFNNSRDGSSETGPRSGVSDYTDALGLLATGDKQYLPELQKYARAVAKSSEPLDIYGENGLGTWHAAYRNLFLTEYFLATNDTEVLPGIKALSIYMSLGQSGVGTWSHGMADVKANGLYGPACAYGAMNAASVPCAISLLLAQKCGIKDGVVHQALTRSLNFYRWYSEKGCLPYGDHGPKLDHDNNGKNSMTAVLFDLAGEEGPARFFTRSTLASYNTRETGHTGNFFSMTWGAPGAARGGPLAAQSFAQNTRWLTELERRHDGNSTYQYQLPSDTKKYDNWSTAGIRLLQHCLPLKAIHLTGKGGCLPPMTAEEVQDAVAAATYQAAGRSVDQLLKDLSNWSPLVRENAAIELGQREENVVGPLIAMLDGPDRNARYGACRALFYAGRQSEDAVNALIKQVSSSDDLTMRYYAVDSLKNANTGGRNAPESNGLGKAVLKAADALLKQAAIDEPEQDPMRKLHGMIATILFYSGRVADYRGYFANGKGLDQVDRKLLIPAVKSLLQNPNGGARTSASEIFDVLPEQDLEQIYGDIYIATKQKAPSGVMFSNGVRNNGAILLSEKKFKEGLPLALDLYFQEGWGAFSRVPAAMKALTNYGSALKPHMKAITEKYEPFSKRGGIDNAEVERIWGELQKNLDTDVPLKSIRPYLEAGGFDPSILDD